MLMTGAGHIDAERAFTRATRARRRAALARRLRRDTVEGGRLHVHDYHAAGSRRAAAVSGRGIREIPIDAINGTLEPSRAPQFDGAFRPARGARSRWQRIWLAEQRGTPMPPISVVPIEGGYALRDGHHRVSVAKARGAATIDATIED